MREYCHTFMEAYSKQRNKPSTQRGYRGVIDRCIIPIMGRMKVQDVKCLGVTHGKHYGGWTRVLKAAGVPHIGTHGIRHRTTTDIANSGVPAEVGMKLTGHKTAAMFMHYVHSEDKPVRDAAELVANRRLPITGARRKEEIAI